MNRLFEALGNLEMDQPLSNGEPLAVAPHEVIELGMPAAVLPQPTSAEEEGVKLLTPEAVPTELIPFDLPLPVSAEEVGVELLTPEAVPTELIPFDLPLSVSAEEVGVEQLTPEAVPAELIPFDVPLPVPAEEVEVEQLTPEAVPAELIPFDVPLLVPEEKAESGQCSPTVVPTSLSPSDAALPGSDQETEREQLSPEAIPLQASLSEVCRPMLAQEEAVAKGSQLKLPEAVAAPPVRVKVLPESRLVALTDPNCLGAEKFRALVTRLERLHKQSEMKRFQVTSSVVNEGKTLIAGNVAVTLAKHFGSKTLLIEGDLHRPALASMFGLNKMRGLNHWWSGRDQELAQFVHRLDDLPLWFLPAGRPFDRPSDILRSTRFVKAFEQLASQFEWIVVDSTPMLAVVEVNLWSRLVDGTLLVVREGVTPVKALKQGLSALDHPKLIGVVLNDASATNEAKYHGHYYGSPNR